MCCCVSPHVNGAPNQYSWDGKSVSTRRPDPPAVSASEVIMCDAPGRCGNGVGDCHSHHFTVVKPEYGGYALLVRHGGGDERIDLGYRNVLIDVLPSLDDYTRYALLHGIYRTVKTAETFARNSEAHRWQTAAVEKRIKTRKQRGSTTVRVWIE